MAFSLETTKAASKKQREKTFPKKQNSALIQGSLCGFQKKVGMIVVNANNLLALQSKTAINCRFITITSTVGCTGNC